MGNPSCLAQVNLLTGEAYKHSPDYYRIGKMSHGLVHWRDRFIVLNSGMGQLVSVSKFNPGETKMLWQEPSKTFMKGLTVVEDVAYFGICAFGTREVCAAGSHKMLCSTRCGIQVLLIRLYKLSGKKLPKQASRGCSV